MATYQGIKGRTVQNLASDPPAAVGQGQVWYNTGTGTLKTSVAIGAWAAGNNLGTARYQIGGCGTQTAGVAWGGYPAPAAITSEEYDGTSWTAANNMVNPRYQTSGQSSGTLTAGLACGGVISTSSPSYSNYNESYDGTSWTANNNQNTGRSYQLAFGVQTAAVAAGGHPSSGEIKLTEEYDGTSWANSNDLNDARQQCAGMGTQTAGIIAGSENPPRQQVEEYDGSCWATVTSLPVSKWAGFGMGIQTNSLYVAGKLTDGTLQTTSFAYDGTSWASSPAVGTARNSGCQAGTASAGLMGGGRVSSPAGEIYTEEFTLADTIQTITST